MDDVNIRLGREVGVKGQAHQAAFAIFNDLDPTRAGDSSIDGIDTGDVPVALGYPDSCVWSPAQVPGCIQTRRECFKLEAPGEPYPRG